MTQRLDCVAQVVESIKSKLSTVLSPAAVPASPAKLRGVVPAALTFMGAAFCVESIFRRGLLLRRVSALTWGEAYLLSRPIPVCSYELFIKELKGPLLLNMPVLSPSS